MHDPKRQPGFLMALAVSAAACIGCAAGVPAGGSSAAPPVVIAPSKGTPKPPFRFGSDDAAMLDEIQRGCFQFFWNEVSPETGMVVDRTSVKVVSVAGVGFELSALPVGVEHGWVTRDDARARAELILRSLAGNELNRRHGLFFHYLDPATAGPSGDSYEQVVSTIDSAILFAGMMTASSYFKGEVARLADDMLDAADWQAYVLKEGPRDYELGFISLGLKLKDPHDPKSAGELLPFVWADAGDEQRLVTFLAAGAAAGRAVEPRVYYRLRRRLGSFDDTGAFVWFPWSGALFTSFFAHCWIDYAAYGTDDPGAFGVEHRARVDWWENARRTVKMHQQKAVLNPKGLAGLGKDAWGLSASDAPEGYAVPGLFPDALPMPGATPNIDYAEHRVTDDYGDGTLAPYAAGSAIMFDPVRAVAALRHYRGLEGRGGEGGEGPVWRGIAPEKREYGFRDAFNQGKDWVASDYVAIDEGPLLLAIENARTGLVWRLFGSHDVAKRAAGRLGLSGEASPSK